ncbi:MAG: M15 family metallopeptidase [Deltaproteobacteria bacterium]|nr:M15 family metallopeptidase [Deltaproteobacteria bacterium]
MRGVSWHEGCPLPLEQLARLELSHHGFDGEPHTGVLVVDAAEAQRVEGIFRALFEARFPIRRMEPIEAFGGDDDASMAADNTSAFNCRPVAGKKTFSQHAWGRAIDLNPRENPYVRGEDVQPPRGRAFLDRAADLPGLLREGGPAVRAFESAGWKWGGRWRRSKDYQHFSVNGR